MLEEELNIVITRSERRMLWRFVMVVRYGKVDIDVFRDSSFVTWESLAMLLGWSTSALCNYCRNMYF